MEYSSTAYHREDSVLHSRYIYTHSDCSSSLSSLSVDARNTQFVFTSFRQQLLQWNYRHHKVLALCSAFLIVSLSAGLCNIHGVFESEYEVRYSPTYNDGDIVQGGGGGSAKYVALIGALQFAVFLASSVYGPGDVVARWLGLPATVTVGAIVSSSGLLTAGFVYRVWQLCLTQGVLVGIGAGIGANVAKKTVDRWSTETCALLAVGSGLGGGMLALVAGRLVSAGTASSALRWLALITLSGQLTAALLLYGVTRNSDRLSLPPVATEGNDSKDIKRQESYTIPSTSRILRLVSHGVHSVTALLPLLFMPSLVAATAPLESSMDGSILVTILCVSWASGSALGPLVVRQGWVFRESLVRLGLSLSVWCLWLPIIADLRALACAFCSAYGVFLGLVGRGESAVDTLIGAAATLIGVPVAGWIVATTGDPASLAINPVAALAAACSLLAAIAAVAADVVESRV